MADPWDCLVSFLGMGALRHCVMGGPRHSLKVLYIPTNCIFGETFLKTRAMVKGLQAQLSSRGHCKRVVRARWGLQYTGDHNSI